MNFKRFSTSDNQWHDVPYYIHNTSTDTLTTLPADIYANDNNATVGLKGNMVQTSQPSPTSPVMPQGTGERTGNLVFVSVDNETHFSNYNQYTISDGTITVTGRMLIGFKVKITPDTTYTVSAVYGAGVLMRIRQYTEIPNDWNNGFINQPVNTNLASATFTTSSEAEWILVVFYSEVVGETINSIMLNLGSTALPFEPFGVKIPISSGGTTTPVYLGEVESTRRIKKLVLTGNETFTYYNTKSGKNVMNLSVPDSLGVTSGNDLVFCTHLPRCSQGDIYSETVERGISTRPNSQILFYDTAIANAPATFKTYLQQQYAAGTPVTVWYVLATEETGIVNEPLRKIGDYADTLSNVSIPVTAGANTLSVGTTVQPSEVTVNYKGWHPVTDVHERDNGAWT